MIPHIQVDDESNDLFGYPTLFASDANRLCCLNVDEIGKFSSKHRNVRAVKRIKIFYNNDVKGFIKKPNLAACFSEYDNINDLIIINKHQINGLLFSEIRLLSISSANRTTTPHMISSFSREFASSKLA